MNSFRRLYLSIPMAQAEAEWLIATNARAKALADAACQAANAAGGIDAPAAADQAAETAIKVAAKQTADALTSTAANVLRAAMVRDRGIMPTGDETFAYDGAWLTISGDQANPNYIADLFREFLHRFERSDVVTFSWASSDNRIGEEEFGGGAAAVSRDAALLQTSTETARLLSLALQAPIPGSRTDR